MSNIHLLHDRTHELGHWELIAEGVVAKPCTVVGCRFRTSMHVPVPDDRAVERVLAAAEAKRVEDGKPLEPLPTQLGRQLFVSVAGALPRLHAAGLIVDILS